MYRTLSRRELEFLERLKKTKKIEDEDYKNHMIDILEISGYIYVDIFMEYDNHGDTVFSSLGYITSHGKRKIRQTKRLKGPFSFFWLNFEFFWYSFWFFFILIATFLLIGFGTIK